MNDYRDTGLKTYGRRCEICGHGAVEVHHIDYQEHQKIEDELRYTSRKKMSVATLVEKAKTLGYLEWDGYQLSKDDRSINLSVLCGNCHNLIHRMDVGKKLLKVLSPRR